MDRFQRMPVEPVQPLPPVIAHLHHPHLAQNPQMLGHLRLGQPQYTHQVADRPFPIDEDIEDLPTPRFGHRIERVRCRCRSCHTTTIYPYGNASRRLGKSTRGLPRRPGLDQALAAVRAGDTLVVPKLDRLARSVPDARDTGDYLVARGVRLSLGGTIYDPTDP